MSHEQHDHALDSFAAQLAALRPASGIDRDALLYAAGRAAGEATAAGRRSRVGEWLSRLALAASLLLAATFAALWWNGRSSPAPIVVEKPVEVAPAPLADEEKHDTEAIQLAAPEESYLHLRHIALRDGVDAWPERWPNGESTPPPTASSRRLPEG
jgi:hypothetical protein